MDLCTICQRDPGDKCHYLACPNKVNKSIPRDCPVCGCNDAIKEAIDHCPKQGSICPYKEVHPLMPVKVKEEPRTLWVVNKHYHGFEPFKDKFYGALLLKPESTIRKNDVVFFDGGTDIDSRIYKEEPHVANQSPDTERDKEEIKAFRRAQAAGAACLGVCRGAQLLVALSGGKLVQHVKGHNDGGHMIFTDNGLSLYSESSHHQVMWPFEIPHVLIAYSDMLAQEPFEIWDEYGKEFPDGHLPEIVFCKDTRSLCIQGHAEWMSDGAPFTKFVRGLVDEFLLQGE